MPCVTISDANPDIAGTGVVLAFGLQALVSLVLSIAAKFLEKPRHLEDFLGLDSKSLNILLNIRHVINGIDLNESPSTITKKAVAQFKEEILNVMPPSTHNHARQGQDLIASDGFDYHATGIGQSIATLILNRIKDNLKTSVQETFSEAMKYRTAMDNAIDTLFKEGSSEENADSQLAKLPSQEVTNYSKKQQSICNVLLVVSDAQTMTGLALIISAMAQKQSLSIYHMHLIYDTINFIAVSNFAAICCAYDNRLGGQRVRYISIGIFGVFYSAFTIIFGIRLNKWNVAIPGQCFNASKIALPNARHPYVDQIYLGVTSSYVFALLLAATLYCRLESIRSETQRRILLISSIQFVVHLYMVIALRISNQSLLNDASLEEAWGFGQILALVMFGSTLVECAKSFEEYHAWSKNNCKQRAEIVEKPN